MELGKFLSVFMEQKIVYDALSQAIRLAKMSGVTDDDLRNLIAIKTNEKEIYGKNVDKLLSLMNNTNVIEVMNGCYAIRYIGDKNALSIKIEFLNDRDIHLLERDVKRHRELTKAELFTIMPGLINQSGIEKYKSQVDGKARNILSDHGITVIDEEITSTIVTFHAGVRWVQRVLKFYVGDDKKAEDYRRSNSAEINEAVSAAFETATLIWTGEDGVEYFFDDNNIIYVKNDYSILTLYESDFGFSKHINRNIVLEQVKVLEAQKEIIGIMEGDVGNELEQITQESAMIADRLEILEAEIQVLNSKKSVLIARRDELSKELMLSKSKLQAESNKLFKKF